MTFQTETEHVARKPHVCDYCGQRIEPGSRYSRVAGHWDGEFFTAKGHADCRQMWSEAYRDWADPYEGMAYNLYEAFGEDSDELTRWRGKYPHVVCRIELGWQKADLQWAARLLAETTYRPDPVEYLHGGEG